MDFEKIVQIYEETCNNIIPYFEEKYDLDIVKPEIAEDRFPGSAMTYSGGSIHVRSDMRWSKTRLQREFSHEFGHAALDQNTGMAKLKEGEGYDDFLISSIEEYVAGEFRNGGLDHLQGRALTDGGYSEATSYSLVGATKDAYNFLNLLFGRIHNDRDQYGLSKELQSEFKVEEIFNNPEPAYEFLEKRTEVG